MGQARFPAGMIRALSAADLPQFRDHLLRLDEEGRRARFAMGATDAFLERYAETAFALGASIFGYFEGGVLRAVGELRPVAAREAEAAFNVEHDLRGRGIGTALFANVVKAARERRLRRLYMSCLAYNEAMQKLAMKFSAELVFEAGDALKLRAPDEVTPRPAGGESGEFATAILTLERRWFGLLSR